VTVQGPIASGPIQRLVSHKEYVVEMVNLIIKDMDMDECGEHATEDFGVFGFFDLVRVSICQFASFFCPLYFLLYYNRCPL